MRFQKGFGPIVIILKRKKVMHLTKDYYIDGQNTQLIFFEKMSTGGGKQGPQIIPRGWIFWIF